MRIEISLKIFAIMILFIILHNFDTYIIFLIFIILHEIAHLVVGIIIGGKPKTIYLNPLGVSLDFYSYKNKSLSKIILLFAGPIINLIFAMIFTNTNILTEYKTKIIYTNIALAIFNVLPIVPLDGGKILYEIIKVIKNSEFSNKFMISFSKTILIIGTLMYSLIILKIHNISILFLLIYLWILFLREERKYELYVRIKKSLDIKS